MNEYTSKSIIDYTNWLGKRFDIYYEGTWGINKKTPEELLEEYLNPVVEEVIENKKDNFLTTLFIKELIASRFELQKELIFESNLRKLELVFARQMSHYLAKNYTKFSLQKIAEEFGNFKSHANVISSINKIEYAIKNNTKEGRKLKTLFSDYL